MRFVQGRVRCCRYHERIMTSALHRFYGAHHLHPIAKTQMRFAAARSVRHPFGNSTRRAFWQSRFYHLNLWTAKKHMEKPPYLHRHPAKRRLVETPEHGSEVVSVLSLEGVWTRSREYGVRRDFVSRAGCVKPRTHPPPYPLRKLRERRATPARRDQFPKVAA